MKNATPKTHDYGPGQRYWSHDYQMMRIVDKGQEIHFVGWGNGISKGDFILIEDKTNKHDGRTRYQVESIKYYSDPQDMWSMVGKFAPRPKPVTVNS